MILASHHHRTHSHAHDAAAHGSTLLNLLHRLAWRVAQGVLACGLLLPLFVRDGELPSLAGISMASAFVLVMFALPRPERTPEVGPHARRPAKAMGPLQRAIQFLI